MRRRSIGCSYLLLAYTGLLIAQDGTVPYTRKNTFAILGEYSNDSSHIIMGSTPNRKIGAVGLQYEHRFYRSRIAEFHYAAEWRPALLESDPIIKGHIVATGANPQDSTVSVRVLACKAKTVGYTYTLPSGGTTQVTIVDTCSRELTFAQGISPAGFVWKFLPGRRLQPTASWIGGMMLSAKRLPVDYAGSFNFTYEFGFGLEYYLAASRSIRLNYQIQHYSNKDTAELNPGVDSGFVKVSYAFGR